jgi:prepilin-type N-terminal cleavage/methylation domain-containing protein
MQKRKGFTLIELLIVIAIILILISIALPNFIAAQTRAKVARVRGDVRALGIAQEMYFQDRRTYTNDCSGGGFGCAQLTTPIRYISRMPNNPYGDHTHANGNTALYLQTYVIATGIWGDLRSLKARNIIATLPEPSLRECYLVYSDGPSKQDPGGLTAIFPQPQDQGGWVVYSPTNGVSSYGGILKAGGSLPPAKRYLLYVN